MSHLYNSISYQAFLLHHHGAMKKLVQARLDQATEQVGSDLHNLDLLEEPMIDDANLLFSYDGQSFPLDKGITKLDCLSEILTEDLVRTHFSSEQIQELIELLPNKDPAELSLVFTSKSLNGKTPLENFSRQLNKGYFTLSREKEDEINDMISNNQLKQIYVDLYDSFREAEEQKKGPQSKMNNLAFKEDQSQLESLEDLESRGEASENSQATETEEEDNAQLEEDFPNQILYRYDYTKLKVQEELLAIGEDRGERKLMALKNIITVKPRNSEWVENFRRQEALRYSNPTKPWVYTCEDGRKVTVAPVAKKLSVLTGKPRYHAMLKNERPACVTILTLARDAAARLPNGVGTRADICELVKESQYITEDLPEEKLSSTISGALDRLHYMSDACVKYDSQKKLWMYLHMERNHDHPGWGDDGDEYVEKNPAKKKKSFY